MVQKTVQPEPDWRLASVETAGELTSVFQTRLGWMAIVVHGNTLRRLVFGHKSALAAAKSAGIPAGQPQTSTQGPPASGFLAEIAFRMAQYAEGEVDDFLDIEVERTHLTPFGTAVSRVVRQIPFGATESYGAIARKVGRPGAGRAAGRAVGRVMAQNRTPLIVPCHRVVASGGRLGGFSAPDGLTMKKRLLQLESRMAFAST